MKEDVALIAAGVCTPFGNLGATVAALADRRTAVRELSWDTKRGRPMRATFFTQEALDPLHRKVQGVNPDSVLARLLRLGGAALQEAAAAVDAPPILLLGVNRSRHLDGVEPPAFLDHLSRQAQVRIDTAQSELILGDRDVGLDVIDRACTLLEKGHPGPLIAGGLDTFCDLSDLVDLDFDGALQEVDGGPGILPGEGAALLVLGNPDGAVIDSPGLLTARTVPPEGPPPKALPQEQLAAAVATMGLDPATPWASVHAHLPGGATQGKAWRAALRDAVPSVGDAAFHWPGAALGDAGAAQGPLLLALALEKLATASPALTWWSSAQGRHRLHGMERRQR